SGARQDSLGNTFPRRGQRLAAARPDPGFRSRAQRQTRFAAFRAKRCHYFGLASRLFVVGRDKLFRRGVESFFVVIGAEVVSRTFVDRLGGSLWIDIHSANRAEGMFGGGNR